jgi:hypothetical protein
MQMKRLFLVIICLVAGVAAAWAYSSAARTSLLKSREQVKDQRFQLEKATDEIDRQIVELQKKKYTIDRYLVDCDRTLKDIDKTLNAGDDAYNQMR